MVAWMLALDNSADARRFRWRSGCSDPCAYCAPAVQTAAPTVAARPGAECFTPSWTELQVVLVPTYVTEKRNVCATTYKDEERTRVVTGYKIVPVSEERVRLSLVQTPQTETKTIEYMSQVAVQTEQQKSYKIKVPVWEDREEQYVVKVPVISEVEETYTVKVPVLKEVPFQYTVNVPRSTVRNGTRTVSTVVPVVKTQTVMQCVPVTRTKVAAVDRGHWETRTGVMSAGRRNSASVTNDCVWVPNVVNEETTVVENQQQTADVEYLVYEQQYSTVPYQCACIEYCPETRTGSKQEVVYQDEPRTRMRTAVNYRDETRTRMTKALTFKEEERTESFPVITYQPQKMTKEVSYTVYVPETKAERYTVTRQEQVPEHRLETYTVRVAVPQVREVDVQVAKMIPKVVSVTVNPCGGNQPGQPRNVAVVPASLRYEPPAPAKCCGG